MTQSPGRIWLNLYLAQPSVLRRGSAEKNGDTPNYALLFSAEHMIRDGGPAWCIYSILSDQYPLAGELLNFPPGVFAAPGGEVGQLRVLGPPESSPDVRANDLIIQATRFPLDDDPGFDKNVVFRSGLPLEFSIAKAQRLFFDHCSRYAVVLSDAVANQCTANSLAFRAIQFATRKDDRSGRISGMALRHGNVKQVTHLSQCEMVEGEVTVGYITFLPLIKEGAPAFLNVFGINGTATLLWTNYVRRNLATWIRSVVEGNQARLLVCTLQVPLAAKSLPSDIANTFDLAPKKLIDVSLSLPPRIAK